MDPRDHGIHLGGMDSPESSPQNQSSARLPFSGPQNRPNNVPGPKCQPRGSKMRPRPPKSVPRPEKTKDARRKPMQNPVLEKSNRAKKRKLWPKTILGGTSQNPGICKGLPRRHLRRRDGVCIVKMQGNCKSSNNFFKN